MKHIYDFFKPNFSYYLMTSNVKFSAHNLYSLYFFSKLNCSKNSVIDFIRTIIENIYYYKNRDFF